MTSSLCWVLLEAAAQQIECVKGCGGGDEGLVVLCIAAASLIMAVFSAIYSKRSVAAATEMQAMARREHAAFIERYYARADFELSIEPLHPHVEIQTETTATIRTNQTSIRLIWKYEIKNTGNRAARDVNVRFVAPQVLGGFAWLTAGTNRNTHGAAGEREKLDEELKAADGFTYPAQQLSKVLDRVGLGAPVIGRVEGDFPETDDLICPVRLEVRSEDLARNRR